MKAEEFYEYDMEIIPWQDSSTGKCKAHSCLGDEIGFSKEEMIAFAEAYHKHRVNEITDEDIELKFNNSSADGLDGALWLKKQLLK